MAARPEVLATDLLALRAFAGLVAFAVLPAPADLVDWFFGAAAFAAPADFGLRRRPPEPDEPPEPPEPDPDEPDPDADEPAAEPCREP